MHIKSHCFPSSSRFLIDCNAPSMQQFTWRLAFLQQIHCKSNYNAQDLSSIQVPMNQNAIWFYVRSALMLQVQRHVLWRGLHTIAIFPAKSIKKLWGYGMLLKQPLTQIRVHHQCPWLNSRTAYQLVGWKRWNYWKVMCQYPITFAYSMLAVSKSD